MTLIPTTKFATVLLLLLLPCCTGTQPDSSHLPTTTMKLGSKTYTLEIAADEPTRAHGLMERDSMPIDHGMIFVYAVPREESFWMYHTRFPLDIIFIGADGKVISTATMKPYDETPVPSHGPQKYAIELYAGQLAENGVKAGDSINVPALPAK